MLVTVCRWCAVFFDIPRTWYGPETLQPGTQCPGDLKHPGMSWRAQEMQERGWPAPIRLIHPRCCRGCLTTLGYGWPGPLVSGRAR
jgi:hypothetical protein